MKRSVSVTATCSFEFEIDDEVVSEWDGAKILDVLESRKDVVPALYTPDATIENLLAFLGINLAVENRTMGNFDGWADFPPEAAWGSSFSVNWDIEDVSIGDPS